MKVEKLTGLNRILFFPSFSSVIFLFYFIFLIFGAGNWNQALCMLGKHSTNWAISLAQIWFFHFTVMILSGILYVFAYVFYYVLYYLIILVIFTLVRFLWKWIFFDGMEDTANAFLVYIFPSFSVLVNRALISFSRQFFCLFCFGFVLFLPSWKFISQPPVQLWVPWILFCSSREALSGSVQAGLVKEGRHLGDTFCFLSFHVSYLELMQDTGEGPWSDRHTDECLTLE